jgi:cytochrome P450 family 3 subfamily A
MGIRIKSYFHERYKKWRKHKRFFKDQNIPGPEPLPLFGNFLDVVTKGMIVHDTELIKKYGRICGAFEGSVPVLMTSDVAFIKAVMIKDFAHFVNRRVN